MVRKMMVLVAAILVLAGTCRPVQVDGYCYLDNQTHHEGTKVLFQADSPSAVTDSTFTDEGGYYMIDVEWGIYDILFAKQHFDSAEVVDQLIVTATTLDDIILGYHSLSGNLEGILEDFDYFVSGEITVLSSDSLIIQPGARLLFTGVTNNIKVYGYFHAVGTAADSIYFIPNDGVSRWGGLGFYDSSSDSCKLVYCYISKCSGYATYYPGPPEGLHIEQCNPTISNCTITDFTEGIQGGCNGILIFNNSSPIIESCVIKNNGYGRGISCSSNSNPIISNSTVIFNSEGGISISSQAAPILINCVISHNEATVGGGISIKDHSDPLISFCQIDSNQVVGGYDVKGGGVYIIEYSDPTIELCEITGNTAAASNYALGGGIYCSSSSNPAIIDCIISHNTVSQSTSFGHGGGLYCTSASPCIENCIIGNNNSSWSGAGLYFHSPIDLEINRSIIINNTAEHSGGGIWLYGNGSINNCTISGNTASSEGSGIWLSSLPVFDILITIVEGNLGSPGIYFGSSENLTVLYSDFNNNEGGNFSGPIPPYLGEFVTTNINGDSCDAFFNIFEDPLFLDPQNGDYHLTENSPCIDAGDPNSPLDPDNTIADIGAFYFDQGSSAAMAVDPIILFFGQVIVSQHATLPLTIYSGGEIPLILDRLVSSNPDIFFADVLPDSIINPGDSIVVDIHFTPNDLVSYEEIIEVRAINADPINVICRGSGIGAIQVDLTPYDPPIVIPETGGCFDFNIAVRNVASAPQTFDLWAEVLLPGFGSAEIILVQDLSLPGGQNIDRDREQTVPEFAPGGTYSYIAYVGEHPWIILDSDSFNFEKEGEPGPGSLGSPSDWLCTGEGFDGWLDDVEPELSTSFNISAFPNPFNPATSINLAIPEAGDVMLSVYDVQARLVTILVDGWRGAGVHEVVWDADGMASGIYLIRMAAGDYSAVKKIVLVK